MVYDLVII